MSSQQSAMTGSAGEHPTVTGDKGTVIVVATRPGDTKQVLVTPRHKRRR